MKNQNSILVALLLCLYISVTPTIAQTIPSKALREKLNKPVQLDKTTFTLEKLCETLSKQTNVVIGYAPELKEHKLSLLMQGSRASLLLESLAELNDWELHVTNQQKLIVRRKRPQLPRSIPEIVPNIQRTLPREIQAFFLIDADFQKAMGALSPEENVKFEKRRDEPFYESDRLNWFRTVASNKYNIADRLYELEQGQLKELKLGEKWETDKLSDETKQKMTDFIFLRFARELTGVGTPLQPLIFSGFDLPQFQFEKHFLYFSSPQDTSLMYGFISTENNALTKYGFFNIDVAFPICP